MAGTFEVYEDKAVSAGRIPAGRLRLLEHPFGIFSAVTFRGKDDR